MSQFKLQSVVQVALRRRFQTLLPPHRKFSILHAASLRPLQAAARLFKVLLTLCDIFTHAAIVGHSCAQRMAFFCVYFEKEMFPLGGRAGRVSAVSRRSRWPRRSWASRRCWTQKTWWRYGSRTGSASSPTCRSTTTTSTGDLPVSVWL